MPPAERAVRWQALLVEDRCRGFDLRLPPLSRFTIVRLDSAVTRLLWSHHHILLDGRSTELILSEALLRYDDPCSLPVVELDPREAPFFRFTSWQQEWESANLANAETYWKRLLHDLPTPAELPWEKKDATDGITQHSTLVRKTEIAAVDTELLRRTAEDLDITLNTLLQSAWALALVTHSGTDDVVFGAIRSGRSGHVEGARDATGLFIRALPVRVRCPASALVADWLRDVRTQHIAVRPFEGTPPSRIHGWLGRDDGASLYDSLVVFDAHESASHLMAHSGGPNHQRRFDLIERADHPLILSVKDGGSLKLQLAGDAARYPESTLTTLLNRVVHFLRLWPDSTSRKLGQLPLLTASELCQQQAWNNTARPIPPELRLHSGFEARSTSQPDAPCIADEHRAWSYGEIERWANQIASHLIINGLGANDLVAVLLDKSPAMLAIILGVIKAGAAYLPIDPTVARQRTHAMLDQAQPSWVFAESSLLNDWKHPQNRVSLVDRDWQSIASGPTSRPTHRPAADALAYAMFTSGSTGVPKLVGVEHRQIANLIDYATRELLDADDLKVVPFIDSVAFDSSVQQIFVTLALGGLLVLVPDLSALHKSCWANRFTSLGTTPSLLSALLVAGSLPASLRVIGLGGEPIPPALLDRLRAETSVGKVINYYGPTEATVYSTVARPLDIVLDSPECSACGRIIGRPIQNTCIRILDCADRQVPVGVIGEIVLSGSGIARGYLSAIAESAIKFRVDPHSSDSTSRQYYTGDLGRFLPDGSVEYVSRRDSQFKRNGLRFEASEVEAHLLSHPAIDQAAVELRPLGDAQNPQLVAYVVGPTAHLEIADLRAYLRPCLPEAMQPTKLVKLARLPFTANGKVDRRALPEPTPPTLSHTTLHFRADDPLEQNLTQIWRRLFQREEICRDASFFSLGGDSLMAVRLSLEVAALVGSSFPIAAFLQTPTIAKLAEILRREHPPLGGSVLVPLKPHGSSPPLLLIHGWGGGVYSFLELAQAMPLHRPVHGVQAINIDGKLPRHTTVEEMAAHYAGEIMARFPTGPYHLAGHSIGGWFAYAVARELRHHGRDVAFLGLLDTQAAARLAPYIRTQMMGLYLWSRLLKHLQIWRQMPSAERIHSIFARWKALRYHIKHLFRYRPTPSDELQITDHFEAVAASYVPEPYVGNIDVFAAAETDPNLHSFWNRLVTGEVRIHHLPGSHLTMLKQPNLSRLTQAIEGAIDHRNGSTNPDRMDSTAC
jgi:amino acid adenylation domain-containing protein